jgi:HEAT repeat protein/MFS family permease
MKRLIYNALSIEEGEGLSVFLLIAQSFFIGVFLQSFEISSTALFMESYGKEMIGNAYLLSGLIGIVLTAIYSALQRSIPFSALAIINLVFITICTAGLWYGFNISEDPRLVFAAFLLMGPLYILSFVGFSGMVGRLFTLRQGKRLFSIVDSGLIFGIIVISFLIPFILKVIPKTVDLILISAASIFISLLFQIVITLNFNLNVKVTSSSETAPKKKKTGISVFVKNKYIRLTSLFVMLTMVAAFFISYSFLAVTKINYPDTKDYAGFLGKFITAVMVFSFIIKTFIYSRLMKTYGLKVNLMILPVLLLFFAAVTAICGTIFGTDASSSSFLIYFLLISLVRFFAINLKDSIQTPSIKLLFQPLDAEIRYDIQAKVEGIINELSAVLAGGLLALLALINTIDDIHYSYILIGIIVAWVYITARLYKEYQNTLRASLQNYKRNDPQTESDSSTATEQQLDPHKVLYAMQLTKKVMPVEYDKQLISLTGSPSPALKKYALQNIQALSVLDAYPSVKEMQKSETDPGLKRIAAEVEQDLKSRLDLNQEHTALLALSKSKNKLEREQAAKIIAANENADYLPILKALLKDVEPNVKIAAFKATAKEIYKELWPVLIDYLESPYFANSAKAALIELNESALDLLEKSFYKSGISSDTMRSITSIIGSINHERSIAFLLDKITFPDRNIILEALHGLNNMNYQADEKNINKIIQAIELNVGIVAWNYSIILDLKRADYQNALSDAMQEELKRSFDLLFVLLSIAYDKLSIQHIRENIESGTTEAISFAIEMLDLFVAEQLKTILFPVLEDNKLEDKVNELELHFPIYRHDRIQVLNQIMNRSSNYVNRYTKACAMYTLLENKDVEVSNDLTANLFNPDPLLRETAAIVMHKIDPAVYENCGERLHDEVKVQLDRSIALLQQGTAHLLLDKVRALKQSALMQSLENNSIIELAFLMKEKTIASGTALLEQNKTEQAIYFITEGEVVLETEGKSICTFGPFEMIGDMLFTETDKAAKMKSTTECNCYEIPVKGLFEAIFKDPELINLLAKIIDKRNNAVKEEIQSNKI